MKQHEPGVMSTETNPPALPRVTGAKEKQNPHIISILIQWGKKSSQLLHPSVQSSPKGCSLHSLWVTQALIHHLSAAICSRFVLCLHPPEKAFSLGTKLPKCAGHSSRFVCILQHGYQGVANNLQQPLLFILTFFCHFWISAKERTLSWFGFLFGVCFCGVF